MTSSSKGGHASVSWGWDDSEMQKRWQQFARFGAGNAQANEITGKNFDKWLKDAGVLDAKHVTTTITGIAFSKVSGPKRKTLNYNESKDVLVAVAEDCSRTSKRSVQDELDAITEKLERLEAPSLSGATKAIHANVVDRLTDVSKYTGAHKERFDPETGKGKGKAGRDELTDSGGYVAAYKNKGTYDKAHK